MKKNLFLYLLITIATIPLFAIQPYRLDKKTDVELKIFTGVPFNFACKSKFGQQLEISQEDGSYQFKKNEIIILATSMRSWIGFANDVLLQTVKAKEHPEFKLSFFSLSPLEGKGQYQLSGSLCIGGVCQLLNFPVSVSSNSRRKTLNIKGLFHGSLASFGLVPPNIMDGSIVVEDLFEVLFNLILVETESN